MDISIAHRIPGRCRLTSNKLYSIDFLDKLSYLLDKNDQILTYKIYKKNSSISLEYKEEDFPNICRYLLSLTEEIIDQTVIDNENFLSLEENDLFDILRDSFETRLLIRLLPMPIRTVLTLYKSGAFLKSGLKSLWNRRLNVDVLDMTAISVSMLSGDFATASSIMFLLGLGEDLEEWTLKKSKQNLTKSLAIQVDKVFVKDGHKKIIKSLDDVEIGDAVYVNMGSVIPVDGKVIDGLGLVNQSSFTGESEPVKVAKNKTVFAGTVLEEGQLLIETTKKHNETRLNYIIDLINSSEENKALAQLNAENKADGLVKYSFLGAGVTYLLTRNFTAAKAFLMVDFSCALKLTMPIAVMKAMNQASDNNVLVKGGKYLEDLAKADTIIFDKTGTLTKSEPMVEKIMTFNPDYDERDCLKIAACLEEHFPHSIANAVVNKAHEENVKHEEMHSEPEYIVAHGISAYIGKQKALIGSAHFIFDDEGVRLNAEDQSLIDELKEEYSLLYLALDNELISVLCISDPLRSDAKETVDQLRDLGFKHIVMLTGDAENAARSVAQQLSLDEYQSQVLPEDKANYIKSMKAKGHTVVMIGDGINDSVALSMADVGISMHKGADIAKEISDIAIGTDELCSLVNVVKLGRSMLKRMKVDHQEIMLVNSSLIALGAFNIISNTTSSFLHNTSTVMIAGNNMKDYIYEE